MKYFSKALLAAMIPFCLTASVANAAETETLKINKQTSQYMNMGMNITRIAIGDPNIATVLQLPGSTKEFLIVTKENPGSTALYVWTADNVRHEYLVVVSPENPGQAMLIEQAIGLPNVHVKMVGERVMLTGTVENQYEKNYALQTARLYVGKASESSILVGSGFDMKLDTTSATSTGNSGTFETNKSEATGEIIDLLQILNPTQVLLEAQIIEINSDDAKDLGIRYGSDPTSSPGIFAFGQDYGSDGVPFRNNPVKWIGQHFDSINASIHFLVTKGKARILSRPSVTTLSGEQATIQIGGEIPYTTTNSNGSTNTSFKNYGIILQFRPIVDAQNRINSAVHTEVSSLSGETVNGQPIISTRSANSVINLNSGDPIVIGGLMDSSETKTVSKIPLLGDIPIIGEFFKHTSKSRDKRELIVVVTPYLVNTEQGLKTPMSPQLRQWYDEEQKYRDTMENFDFKEAQIKEKELLALKEKEKERANDDTDAEVVEPFKN
ncbi:MAG: pilus assembly protein N-terminal domain-containing protein [Selenomonadaceae bacterium]|nr:pilus assembly protein N-terminal domain-containing protein [Selenomonadaceae bacterium]